MDGFVFVPSGRNMSAILGRLSPHAEVAFKRLEGRVHWGPPICALQTIGRGWRLNIEYSVLSMVSPTTLTPKRKLPWAPPSPLLDVEYFHFPLGSSASLYCVVGNSNLGPACRHSKNLVKALCGAQLRGALRAMPAAGGLWGCEGSLSALPATSQSAPLPSRAS